MFWTLVTVFIAGFAGAGIGLLLRNITRKRLPKGVVPICAGLTMIAATIGQEYGWERGVRATMAEDLVIVSTREQQAWYQPWTFIRPWTRGFIGYSPSEAVETAPGSGLLAVQLRIQERWQPQMVRPALVDCANARWTDITPELTFAEDGQPIDVRWRETGPDDPIITAVCGGETASG
ncbi:hypothetical protein [Roseicyclus persicicus]|uniref:Uncharacterized protein n=1 Tax=Roseicyclus persicicus TaxID=2650661 RepID=A0A7X6H289_9RHOB|nr:hypothetical protein [Roseibacterium persicicum]NKX45476.1 hypothetical protein [Roseibacterium persicicum]